MMLIIKKTVANFIHILSIIYCYFLLLLPVKHPRMSSLINIGALQQINKIQIKNLCSIFWLMTRTMSTSQYCLQFLWKETSKTHLLFYCIKCEEYFVEYVSRSDEIQAVLFILPFRCSLLSWVLFYLTTLQFSSRCFLLQS